MYVKIVFISNNYKMIVKIIDQNPRTKFRFQPIVYYSFSAVRTQSHDVFNAR